jgi:hypothetical protein
MEQTLLAPKTKPKGVGASAAKTLWQNRIVGHADVPPGELVANGLNWRLHGKAQQAALSGAISEVGWVAEGVALDAD